MKIKELKIILLKNSVKICGRCKQKLSNKKKIIPNLVIKYDTNKSIIYHKVYAHYCPKCDIYFMVNKEIYRRGKNGK